MHHVQHADKAQVKCTRTHKINLITGTGKYECGRVGWCMTTYTG